MCSLKGGAVRHSGDNLVSVFHKYSLGAILQRRAGYTLGFAMHFSSFFLFSFFLLGAKLAQYLAYWTGFHDLFTKWKVFA